MFTINKFIKNDKVQTTQNIDYLWRITMSVIRVHLCPQELRTNTFVNPNLADYVKQNFSEYEPTHRFSIPLNGVEAAEETYDLTNNPLRDEEREYIWGILRPICVGDVIECVGDTGIREFYLCENVGWTKQDFTSCQTVVSYFTVVSCSCS